MWQHKRSLYLGRYPPIWGKIAFKREYSQVTHSKEMIRERWHYSWLIPTAYHFKSIAFNQDKYTLTQSTTTPSTSACDGKWRARNYRPLPTLLMTLHCSPSRKPRNTSLHSWSQEYSGVNKNNSPVTLHDSPLRQRRWVFMSLNNSPKLLQISDSWTKKLTTALHNSPPPNDSLQYTHNTPGCFKRGESEFLSV